MPDAFKPVVPPTPDPTLEQVALRLGVAFLLGLVVGAIYLGCQRVNQERRPFADVLPLTTTLVLLTILIAMVTLVIGSDIARAFSLVGALAIIRFRTVVEDTRDTAFVIFAVVVGMAVGAHHVDVALIGIPIVGAAALTLSAVNLGTSAARDAEATLSIRLGLGHDPRAVLTEVFGRRLARHRLLASATARQGAAVDLTYAVELREPEGVLGLVEELGRLEGVQSVELRRPGGGR
jgi:hypothetical protein